MKIALNGEEYQTEASTVEGLLEELRISAGRVAVELNLEIIKKIDYQVRGLKEGDRVEIVNFVGGG